MVALAQRVSDGFARVASEVKNAIRPRLIPPGGLTNYTLIKAGNGDYQVGWAAPPLTHFADVYCQDGKLFTNDPAAPFIRVGLNAKNVDAENLFDVTTAMYTVKEKGLYLINATFRPGDSAGSFEFGFGVHTAQVDGPHFFWVQRPNVTRWTAGYSRIVQLNVGDQLRMFVYNFQTFQAIANAGMQIGMISKSF